METYRFGDIDEAIEMLKQIKKQGKSKIMFTIDFDNDISNKNLITPAEGCVLVRKSKTIVINEDEYLPHMQLFSIKQNNLENIIKRGIMHDIIL